MISSDTAVFLEFKGWGDAHFDLGNGAASTLIGGTASGVQHRYPAAGSHGAKTGHAQRIRDSRRHHPDPSARDPRPLEERESSETRKFSEDYRQKKSPLRGQCLNSMMIRIIAQNFFCAMAFEQKRKTALTTPRNRGSLLENAV
ncbi:MAG: hypothetical protein VCB99_04185 [Myxococcota bacterium]